jgi:FtsH-binding integral membrane protein
LINDGKSIVARFKGKVPAFFLIIHIIFMVFGFIYALRTGMEALRKDGKYQKLVLITFVIAGIGGMILGPIVQKYAFGDFWTGFPFGIDLTDNKTLIAFIFWLFAFFMRKRSRWWVVLAAAVMIVVYLIPHSALGSELDYESGTMKNKYSRVQILNTQYRSRIKTLC